MPDANSNTVDASPKPDALALDMILNEPLLELFCDIVGQPCIRLPPPRDLPAEEPWKIRSERVRAWIADLIWERFRFILLDREIDRILNVLEGKAWRDQRRNVELCHAIEQDSLFEAILLFMEEETLFEGTMTKLLRELVKVGKRAGLDVKARDWPKGSPQLSSRIGKLEHLLAAAQIGVERNRDSYERRVILKRMPHDGGASPPSQGPSVDKSHHPKAQRQHDATDPEKRAMLFARVSQPIERKEL